MVLEVTMGIQARVIRHHHSSTHCSEPDDTTLYNSWVEYLEDDNGQSDNFYLLPALRSTIATELEGNDNHTHRYLMAGRTECPTMAELQSRKSVEERSTCPWHFVLNYDQYR